MQCLHMMVTAAGPKSMNAPDPCVFTRLRPGPDEDEQTSDSSSAKGLRCGMMHRCIPMPIPRWSLSPQAIILKEECRRGVSGSSHLKVADLKEVCHSSQRDGLKGGYHSYLAGCRSSCPEGMNGFVSRTGWRAGGHYCPFQCSLKTEKVYESPMGSHPAADFLNPAYTLLSVLLLRELLI
jgi:hypothetical protein